MFMECEFNLRMDINLLDEPKVSQEFGYFCKIEKQKCLFFVMKENNFKTEGIVSFILLKPKSNSTRTLILKIKSFQILRKSNCFLKTT